MIITLPNYLTQNPNLYKLIYDKNFVSSKSSTYKKDKLSLRNSTHMIILLINGSKVIHLKNKDIMICHPPKKKTGGLFKNPCQSGKSFGTIVSFSAGVTTPPTVFIISFATYPSTGETIDCF